MSGRRATKSTFPIPGGEAAVGERTEGPAEPVTITMKRTGSAQAPREDLETPLGATWPVVLSSGSSPNFHGDCLTVCRTRVSGRRLEPPQPQWEWGLQGAH